MKNDKIDQPLIISYEVIRDTKGLVTRYYENSDSQK